MTAHNSAIRAIGPSTPFEPEDPPQPTPVGNTAYGPGSASGAALGTKLCDAIAATLRGLSEDIERIGTELCADADLGVRHLDNLQAIDRTAQHLNELSRVIASPDPDVAIDAVTLSELRDCLLAAATDTSKTPSDGDDHV